MRRVFYGRRRGRKPRPVSATTIARRQAIPLSDLWRTPAAVIEAARLVAGVEAWQLDAAAYDGDRVAPMWLGQGSSIAVDALAVAWPAVAVWCNPPYSVTGGPLAVWVARCVAAQDHGATVALLVPMSSSAAWFGAALCRAELYRFTRRISFLPPAGLAWDAAGSRHDPALFVFRPDRRGAGSLSTLTIPDG